MNLSEVTKNLSNDDIEIIASLRASLDEYMHHPLTYNEFLENEFVQTNCEPEQIPVTIQLLWEQNKIMGNRLKFSVAALLLVSNFSYTREVLNFYLAQIAFKAKKIRQFDIDLDFLTTHIFDIGKIDDMMMSDHYKEEIQSQDYWNNFFSTEQAEVGIETVFIGFPNDDEYPINIVHAKQWEKKVDIVIGDTVFFRVGDLYLRTDKQTYRKIEME